MKPRSARSKKTPERVYEQRRWQEILEDLSSRPNLERAQAEAIGHRALAVEGDTPERRRDIEQTLLKRFGPSAAALAIPVPVPVPAAVVSAAAAPVPPVSVVPPKRGKATQGVLNPEWLASPAPPPPLPTTQRRLPAPATRKPAKLELRRSVDPDLEAEFRRLLVHLGFDKAHVVLDDLKRHFDLHA